MIAPDSSMLPLGASLPAFSLPDVASQAFVTADAFSASPVLVVVFLCAHCPYVHHVTPELKRVSDDYKARGVAFVGITSNDVAQYPDDAPEPTAAYAKAAGWQFPILFDESQAVARSLQAACTPEFYVFDKARKLTYRGRIDGSRPARGQGRPAVSTLDGAELRAALDATLQGAAPTEPQHPATGCSIKWKPGNAPA